jgi:glycosyltransferase involved in cell wall biosynthesis
VSLSIRQILPKVEKTQKLCVVVPAFNEQANLGALLRELSSLSIAGHNVEVLVVDDGSTDQTATLARSFGVKTLSLAFNVGIGGAVQTGFQYALAHEAEFVVQVDGDGQHIPSEIAKLVAHLEGHPGTDVVVGSRYLGSVTKNATTPSRRWAGAVLSWILLLLTGVKVLDPTSGFRIFRRRAAEFVARQYPDDYPEVEVLVTLLNEGFHIEEIPARMRARSHGKSSIRGWRSVYYMMKVVFSSFMHRMRKSL